MDGQCRLHGGYNAVCPAGTTLALFSNRRNNALFAPEQRYLMGLDSEYAVLYGWNIGARLVKRTAKALYCIHTNRSVLASHLASLVSPWLHSCIFRIPMGRYHRCQCRHSDDSFLIATQFLYSNEAIRTHPRSSPNISLYHIWLTRSYHLAMRSSRLCVSVRSENTLFLLINQQQLNKTQRAVFHTKRPIYVKHETRNKRTLTVNIPSRFWYSAGSWPFP